MIPENPWFTRAGLSCLAGVMVALWIGLLLAEMNCFAAWWVLLSAVVAGGFAWRHFRRSQTGCAVPRAHSLGLLAVGALALSSLVFTIPPSEFLLGGWDPGVYVHTASVLARDGGLLREAPDLAALDADSRTLIFHYPPAFRSLRVIADGDGCSACGIFGILGVIASGHYALCGIGEQVPELVFGKVGVDALETVWRENALLNALREGLPDRLEGVCGRCLMKEQCLGSCVAQNFYSKGSLWAPYWFCEQAEAAGLFPVSRLSGGPGAAEHRPVGRLAGRVPARRGRVRS